MEKTIIFPNTILMRITKLDGLRGLFCIMILLYHYWQDIFCFGNILPEFIVNNFFVHELYMVVDFFFVLSGFVISYTYSTVTDFYKFMQKRLIRLYPLLFFSVVVFVIFEITFKAHFSHFYHYSFDLPVIFVSALDSLFLTNATNLLYPTMGANPPSWSISSEVISYMVFATVSIYPMIKKRAVLSGLVMMLCVIFSVYNETFFTFNDFGFIRGLLSFNVGYFVWELSKKDFKIPVILEYLLPFLWVGLIYGIHSLPEFPMQMVSMITIPSFFGAALLVVLKTDGVFSRFLETKPLQFLGKISYSIYLNHYVFVLTLPIIAFKLIKIPQNTGSELLIFAVTTGITIVYSIFTYHYIELKCSKALRKKLGLNLTPKPS